MIKNILRAGFALNVLLAFVFAQWAASSDGDWSFIVVASIFGFFIVHIVLIATQFAISAVANKGLVGMSVSELFNAYALELRYAVLTFGWRQPWRESADADQFDNAQGKRGVLFLHGYFCNRGLWREQMAALRAQGTPHMAITLEPAFGSISAYANAVHEAVEKLHSATGMAPVIVGHSMGGLAARAYVAAHSAGTPAHGARTPAHGAERVQRIITLGTPHHGTFHAQLGHAQNTAEMQLQSEWLKRNATQLSAEARAKFVCFYSNGDNIVAPFESATLEGAENQRINATGHVSLAFTAEFREALAKALKI
jgi:triacylglycerol lipase